MRNGALEPASLQRMLYDALEQSDDLVVVLEQSGPDHENLVVATANDGFCRVMGRSHDELTGQTFASFAAAEGERDRWAEIMGAVRGHRSIRSEMLCSGNSGRPRWATVASRAMSSADYVIRRRCGSHDTWSRTADGGFLICFATATEDEAAFRASAMAREIRIRLIGDGETEATATVSAIAAAVDVPQVPGRSGDILAL
jgi:PAS domain S-box-containing protein